MLLTDCANKLPNVLLEKIAKEYQQQLKASILQFEPTNISQPYNPYKETSENIITILGIPYQFNYSYRGNHSSIVILSIRPLQHIQQDFIRMIFTQYDNYPYSRPGCFVDDEIYVCIHKIPKKYNKTHLPFVLAQGLMYVRKMSYPILKEHLENEFQYATMTKENVEIYNVKKTYKPVPIEDLYDEVLEKGSIHSFLKTHYTFAKSFDCMNKTLQYYRVSRW
jgi:hypothetical protein